MDRRHSPGHQAGAIGHAYRTCDVEPVERRAARGNRIDMRRTQHRMTIAAEEVGAVLVGDEQKEVQPGTAGGGHRCSRECRRCGMEFTVRYGPGAVEGFTPRALPG